MLDWLLDGAQTIAEQVMDFGISVAEWSFSLLANGFTKLFDFGLSVVSGWLS